MLKVVFDTNVYISALTVRESKAEAAYLHAVEGHIELFTSLPILTETAQKLREKFLWDDASITDALKHICRVATIAKPDIKLNVLQDEPDNRVLECAKAVNADLVVTGDKHILSLKEYEGTGLTNISGLLHSIQ